MKVKPHEAEAYARRPPADIMAVLVYGPDRGLAREMVESLVRSVAGSLDDPFAVVELTGKEAADDRARLADELHSPSLMGGRRAIRVRDAGDAVAASLENALSGPPGDNLIVLEAGDLPPRSTLRGLCEKAKNAAAMPCYLPDADGARSIIHAALRQAGLEADAEALAELAQRLAGDRGLLRRELDKLIAFVGPPGAAAPANATGNTNANANANAKVDLAAVRACIGDVAEQTMDDLTMAVGDGDAARVDYLVDRLAAEGVAVTPILRAVQRHFLRLHLAAGRMAAGDSPEKAMAALRPPVFFKQQPSVRAQLRRWSLPRLGEALDRLQDTEAATRQTGAPADLLTARCLLQIASLAKRRG